MPTILDRYQSGDHEAVWSDLMRLGPQVREKEYLADAYAVAQETMRRARHNVETIIVRLEKLGYEFLTANRNAANSLHGLSQALAMFQAADRFAGDNAHLDPLRKQSRSLLDSPMFRGLLGGLQKRAAEPPPREALKNPEVFSPPAKNIEKNLRAFEKSIGGPIPLSLRAWCEVVGSVSLMGTHPVLCFRESAQSQPMTMFMSPHMFQGPGGETQLQRLREAGLNIATELPSGKEMPLADPLVIDGDPEAWGDDSEDDEIQPIMLAPDDLHKADISGDAYYMEVPNASADARFLDWHEANFVDYLRIAFRWGGFPGWERYGNRPEKELAYLAEGLLAI